MKESDIEKYLREHLEGFFLKFVSPGQTGVPDRIWIGKGKIVFIEVKKPGGVLSPRQVLWLKRLNALDHEAIVIGSMEEAREYVRNV
jgi:hypothetical protein